MIKVFLKAMKMSNKGSQKCQKIGQKYKMIEKLSKRPNIYLQKFSKSKFNMVTVEKRKLATNFNCTPTAAQQKRLNRD